MSAIMNGAEVAAAMKEKLAAEMGLLKQKNISTCKSIEKTNRDIPFNGTNADNGIFFSR